MPHTLRTERLLLRPPSLRDGRDMARVLNDWRILSNTGTWSFPLSQERATFRLRQALKMEPLVDHVFAVLKDGEFVGTCGIHRQEGDAFFIGYMLGADAWGHGIATEAARAVVEFGFRTCRAGLIFGDAFTANIASCRVLEKAGMRFVREEMGWSAARGSYFPMRRYEMTRTDFRS